MEVKNYMEVVLNNMLLNILKNKEEFCNCKRCLADTRALALNHLPPKYIATESGEVYSKVNALSIQFETDVIKAVIDAAEKVKQSPRH